MKRFFVFVFAAGLGLAAADTLDFGRHTVIVTVQSRPGLAPLVDINLQGRALVALKKARYDRDLSVADFLAARPRDAAKLERMTFAGRPAETKYHSDGSVTVDHEFPLTGAILEQLAPKTGGGKLLGRVACPCCGQAWPEGREVPEGLAVVPYETGAPPAYSGILIDCRGLGLKPAVFPRAVDEQDREAWGVGFAERKEIVARGMAGYYRNRNEAAATDRIGANPLVIRAIDVTGANSCDAVVSAADAARLHGFRAYLDLLLQCRVGFLID